MACNVSIYHKSIECYCSEKQIGEQDYVNVNIERIFDKEYLVCAYELIYLAESVPKW